VGILSLFINFHYAEGKNSMANLMMTRVKKINNSTSHKLSCVSWLWWTHLFKIKCG